MTPDQALSILLVIGVVGGVWLLSKLLKWIGDFLAKLVKPAAWIFLPPGALLLGLTVGTGQTFTNGQDWLTGYVVLLLFWGVFLVVFRNQSSGK